MTLRATRAKLSGRALSAPDGSGSRCFAPREAAATPMINGGENFPGLSPDILNTVGEVATDGTRGINFVVGSRSMLDPSAPFGHDFSHPHRRFSQHCFSLFRENRPLTLRSTATFFPLTLLAPSFSEFHFPRFFPFGVRMVKSNLT